MLTVDFDRLGLRPAERVLDLGCGGGRHAFECLRRGAVVVALDADPVEVKGVIGMMVAMVEAGEVGDGGAGVGVRGDALRLPFPDGAFDKVICAEVLEHLADDSSAMAELARVLRPGGLLAISVPRYGPELVNWALSERYHSVPGGHLRIYRRSQLLERLEDAGLELVALPSRPRAPQPVLVAPVPRRAGERATASPSAATTASSCGTSRPARRSPAFPRRSSTRCWARAWSST